MLLGVYSIRRLACAFSWAVLASVMLSGCIPNRRLIYLPSEEYNTEQVTRVENPRSQYRLQPRDILSVRIITLDQETSEYFNIEPSQGFFNLNPAGFYLNGYSVSDSGHIVLPEVGKLMVEGLTVVETEAKIREAITPYLDNVTVIVKLVSFKVTVLGEVRNPGYFYVYNDQANLLEVLGLAGDLTDEANRSNITLIRQTADGSEVILLDLQDPELLSSPYYYIQPNDAIYAQPVRAKNTRDNIGSLGLVSILFGAISTTVLLINFINNQ